MSNRLKLFKTDERDETRELGSVLWRLRRAAERLPGDAVLHKRQSEGQWPTMYKHKHLTNPLLQSIIHVCV